MKNWTSCEEVMGRSEDLSGMSEKESRENRRKSSGKWNSPETEGSFSAGAGKGLC